MDVVYAIETASVGLEGAQIAVRAGTHWPADDPIVRAYPGLFADDARYGLSYSGPRPPSLDEAPVEQATAAPGEKRSTVKRG